MSLYINKVREFHSVFGHPYYDVPQEKIFTEHPDRVTLRIALIKEEVGELNDAFADDDRIEVADACADIMYVVAGMALVFGSKLEHVDNMTKAKMGGTFKNRAGNAKGYHTTNDRDIFEKKLGLINKFFALLEKTCNEKDFEKSMKVLNFLAAIVKEFSWNGNIDLDTAFNEVHRSNMTKVCATEEDAVESIKRLKDEGRYKEPMYRKSDCGKYYVLYDNVTQKILKNYKYETPKLEKVIGL